MRCFSNFYYLLVAFILLSSLNWADAQTLCTKFTVIKPTFSTKTVKLVITPATYKTDYQYITIKQGFWDIEYKSGLPCKTWREPVRELTAIQVLVSAEITKEVIVTEVDRQGDVIAYVSDCQ